MMLPPPSTTSVVLVEDDPALLSALTFALRIDGHEIYPYASASAMLAGGIPPGRACLVIDQGLPDMTGVDLLEALRSQGDMAPAILIAGSLRADVRARANTMFLAVIDKPLLGNSLSEAISAALP